MKQNGCVGAGCHWPLPNHGVHLGVQAQAPPPKQKLKSANPRPPAVSRPHTP
ncbi:hypothetical protein B0T18DRAFT_77582 [Schizothecium vesticola]|uniref:Uncharacterized protein n=1 Tax=Schizothecium vesticola TaxID=314040 RepID=A0AA40F6M1_9PEZI|nr:hypothetical protein B0T18DRAFT_77582 [Schizothecium vesticola]